MIYELYLDGKLLYYPDDEEYAIYNSSIEEALNDSGTLEFEIPKTNPLYDAIYPRKSIVAVFKDKKEIFCGEVRESEEVIEFTKSVYVVGELAFLADSIQPQARFQDYTPLQFFTALIDQHNSQVEEKKRFAVGIVTVEDPNDSLYRYTNYEDTLTALRSKLCDSLGGYLRIRKENGVRYLDLVGLEDYGKTCEQPIKFGINLLDYSANSSGNDIATAVIPLGAKLEEGVVEGLDAYTTIESVNDGRDYVYNVEAVEQFGWIKAVVHWDDVTEPANLKRKAEEWLSSNQYASMTLELNAVDLSMLKSSIDAFELGDYINAIADPFGMNTWFPVQKKKTYLQETEKNKIMLSNTLKKSYTQQMADKTNEILSEMPQERTLLQQARENSSNLIKDATNGNIVLKMDENNNPAELLIMDTKDIAAAKKVWRWNLGGLGFSSTGYDGEYTVAMTMDGTIIADFIGAGTMLADRIKGGTLTLGGENNTDGKIEVYDANKKLVGQWTKDLLRTLNFVVDDTGVSAENLHATTWLIVGENSRFEDYTDASGEKRTGCFWIGETGGTD